MENWMKSALNHDTYLARGSSDSPDFHLLHFLSCILSFSQKPARIELISSTRGVKTTELYAVRWRYGPINNAVCSSSLAHPAESSFTVLGGSLRN